MTIMDVAEAMIKYIIHYVLENAPEEMKFFNSFVDKTPARQTGQYA